MQVPAGDAAATHERHFHEMWMRAFSGFLASSCRNERICFAPELLPNWAVQNGRRVEINYARMKQTSAGPVGETDRWLEGLTLCAMASRALEEISP
jgi:hypothetical protein